MKNILLLAVLFTAYFQGKAQGLADILNNELPQTKEYVTATFKGTRILNGHSIENRKKGTLDFIIAHRFGRINGGAKELFGLDQAFVRFALEYAPVDNLTIGVGRSSFEKAFDGFTKFKFLKQTTDNSMPITASVFGSVAYESIENGLSFNENLNYVSQLLIARKFSPAFSFQIMPTYIHFNSVFSANDTHNIFSLGFGTRIKLTKRMALNAEYFQNFDKLESIDAQNSLALGWEIETGGHVFQIIFSNSETMIEKGFIGENSGDFFGGDIHLGFNISRSFQVGSHQTKKLKKIKQQGNQ